MAYNASPNEQLMLELLNRARLDPAAEAARFGIDLNEGLGAGTLSANARQPVAMNENILAAARGHSTWMIDNDVFSHTGSGGSSPGNRMTAAGYVFSGSWTWGENIAWSGTTGTPNLTQMIISQHRGLFVDTNIDGRGHRLNMLNDGFRETGIGQIGGVFTRNGVNYNASMVTQDFARSGTSLFILGVSYDDSDGDDFYSVGEGRSAVHVATGAVSTDTGASGGYSLAVSGGVQTVTFSGGGLVAPMTVTVDMGSANIKLDVVNGSEILSSGSITLGSAANTVTLLGVANLSANGSSAADWINGNRGNNVLNGHDGADTINGEAGDDTLAGGLGNDTLAGGDGADTLDGGDGADTLFGGAGIDQLIGGNGNDILYVVGNDSLLQGNAGFDQVIVLDVASVTINIGTGVEYVAGNNGNDTVSAAATTTAITIGGAGGNDTLTGGSAGDTLAGGDGIDTMNGGAGNDIIFGGTGADFFDGGDGDDILYVMGNDASLIGGAGTNDKVIVLDTAGVSINIGLGVEYVAGNSGNDTLSAAGLTTALTMGGAGGNDTITGGSGGDTLAGGIGVDTLFGGLGNDTLFGGDGNDNLFGGGGNDTLIGGAGLDTFFFENDSGNDFVFSFENGSDKFNFASHTLVNSMANVTITNAGADAYVTLAGGGHVIVFGGAGLVDAGDFIF